MGFFSEKMMKLGVSPEEMAVGFKITQYEGIGCVVEGHRGIVEYKHENIRIRLRKGIVRIEGRGLTIKEVCKSEIIINGKVERIAYE